MNKTFSKKPSQFEIFHSFGRYDKKTAENWRNFNDAEKRIVSKLQKILIPHFCKTILSLESRLCQISRLYLYYCLRYKPSKSIIVGSNWVRPGQLYIWIQYIKIRKLVFIRSLHDHFHGFYALSTILIYTCRRSFSCDLINLPMIQFRTYSSILRDQ